MSQEDSHGGEQTPEHWFSIFEDECLNELETQGRIEPGTQSAEEYAAQQLWLGFQQTSTAIAQLYNYKDVAHDGYLLLVPFNRAAESLTKFYKDSLYNARECLRLGVQCGRSSRARDIAAWARKKRKCIRRDELLAYLCGKSLPSHAHHHRSRRSIERQLPRRTPHQNDVIDSVDYPVRESIALQNLNGGMSNSMNNTINSSCTVSAFSKPPVVDDYFYPEDWVYNPEQRKRSSSSSSTDVNMESPSRKRGRFQ
ncbi:hypothetical protein BsWGS_05711 [Bradybaena similaris]